MTCKLTSGHLPRCVPCAFAQGPILACSVVTILKFLTFEHRALHFCFALGPGKLYGWSCLLSWHIQPPPVSFYRTVSFHFSLCTTSCVPRDSYPMPFLFPTLCFYPPLLCIAHSYSRTRHQCHLLFKFPLCQSDCFHFEHFLFIY